jgi:uncharacterized repeat protein (TIGR03803 family)
MKIVRMTCVLAGFLLLAVSLPGQTVTTLYSFTGALDGEAPTDGLIQATDGYLYGTTYSGSATSFCAVGCGTVFKIATSGVLTTVYTFCSLDNCTDGAGPYAGLVQTSNGNFYGTTLMGGSGGFDFGVDGTVFEITPSDTLTTLHSFCIDYPSCPDGFYPYAGLFQASNGNLYGSTSAGGASNSYGTFFEVTPSGTFTTLDMLNGVNGSDPFGGLIQVNQLLYGTTRSGGANGMGNVFSSTLGGTLTTLASFTGYPTGGAGPEGTLIQASDGNFYGTTVGGGTNDEGTIFRMSPSGTLTTIYNFCSLTSCADGARPEVGLIQATDGNLYGTTSTSASDSSTIYKITLDGAFTTLYTFSTGNTSQGVLLQSTDGNLYGTTEGGGTFDAGTVFKLSLGLAPFVEARPTSGRVGARITILGTHLTGATSVTFNGTSATFTVVSASEITTTVPTGATTGIVEVKTPHSTLKSNTKFHVTP